jgi:hypothetical protein
MATLGDIKEDVRKFASCYKTEMAKRKDLRLTPEDEARHERIMEMVRERIAYHEAKAREEEKARARERRK